MRTAFWLLALFALAVAIALVARLDQGYVIVVFPPWRMELSFMLALLLLAALMGLAYLLLHLAGTALSLPRDLRAWRDKRRQAAAQLALLDAVRAHLDGDAARVRKLLKKAADSPAPDLVERLKALAAGPSPAPAQTPAAAPQLPD